MKSSISRWGTLVTVVTSLLVGFPATSVGSSGELDVCSQVSAEQLKALYHKRLYANAFTNECNWSEDPGGMAYMNIQVRDTTRPLREYFAKPLPSRIKLVKITDLGDEGLMSVGEGTLGIVAVRKGKHELLSAVTFLDIKPNSKRQVVLWDIYRDVLKRM